MSEKRKRLAGSRDGGGGAEPDYTDPGTAAGVQRRRFVVVGPFEFHPVVFPVSVSVIIGLVAAALFAGELVEDAFGALSAGITNTFGWLYILTLSGFLLFALWLGYGPYGHVRLGKDDEKPEFNRLTWFTMLFSAGMGIGLLFWGVAEPLSHYNNPPGMEGGTLEAARESMAITLFHWGLHPWGMYAIVALSLAYFGFRRGLPLSFRSVFYPLVGERVHGWFGDVIDVLAVVSTLFGVATSLGLGAAQVNAGLNHLTGLTVSPVVQIGLIGVITAIATVSVVLGLHVGIRRLSEANMTMAALLLLFVFVFGPTLFLVNAFVENIGAYLQRLPTSSFWTATFEDEGERSWLGSWTVYYWGWWIAWSPFVGMFIARVSRGRTIREFVTGVLIAPTLIGAVWLTVFGNTAIHQDVAEKRPGLVSKTYSTPEVPVVAEFVGAGPAGELPVAEDGRVVGPAGYLFERGESGGLVAADGERVRFVEGESGGVMAPVGGEEGVVWEGAEGTPTLESEGLSYATELEPLTPADFLASSTVTTEDGTQVLSYDDRVSTILFVMLEPLPLMWLTALVATLCVVLFFVTSSDSASMVIDIIATGGNPDPPVGTRLFWAIGEGVVASVLLVAGGLKALQTASITAALPFTVVLIFMCVSLFRALSEDEMTRLQRSRHRAVKAAERAASRVAVETAENYFEEREVGDGEGESDGDGARG